MMHSITQGNRDSGQGNVKAGSDGKHRVESPRPSRLTNPGFIEFAKVLDSAGFVKWFFPTEEFVELQKANTTEVRRLTIERIDTVRLRIRRSKIRE